MTTEKKPSQQRHKPKPTPCETCVHYDVIDEDGSMGCTMDIDEDEAYRERTERHAACPYYRYYNEYLSVRKQN